MAIDNDDDRPERRCRPLPRLRDLDLRGLKKNRKARGSRFLGMTGGETGTSGGRFPAGIMTRWPRCAPVLVAAVARAGKTFAELARVPLAKPESGQECGPEPEAGQQDTDIAAQHPSAFKCDFARRVQAVTRCRNSQVICPAWRRSSRRRSGQRWVGFRKWKRASARRELPVDPCGSGKCSPGPSRDSR